MRRLYCTVKRQLTPLSKFQKAFDTQNAFPYTALIGGGADDFSAALELIQAGARDLVAQLAVLLAGHAPA